MKIKKLIAGMMAAAMLAGPGTMTCYAAESNAAVPSNTANTEETAAEAGANNNFTVSSKEEGNTDTGADKDPATDAGAESTETSENEKLPYTVTVDEDGNTVYSFGDWEWSIDDTENNTSAGIVNDQVSSYLHLRSGSGMEYDIIGHLLPGEKVQVVGEDGEWYQVVVPEKTGYVSKDYLKVLEKEKKDGTVDQEFMETMLGLMMESMEDEKSSAPLTPDGNMTLVDDIGSSTGAGKQFITLVTKNGNYFYLIIDRDEDGNENVHFLNQVDEADLFALMDKDEAAALQTEKESQDTEKEKTAEEPAASATSSEVEEIKPEDSKPAKKSVNVLPLAAVIILLTAAGGGYFYFQVRKKKKTAQKPDPDADYEQDESEEEYEIPDEDDEEETEITDDHDEEPVESESEEGDLNE
ncbi:MAG: CD1107 family mobile element protein [Eubacterium sp.]